MTAKAMVSLSGHLHTKPGTIFFGKSLSIVLEENNILIIIIESNICGDLLLGGCLYVRVSL